MIRVRLLILILSFLPWTSVFADGLGKLESDPSGRASERLADLYKETHDSDQRYWIVHALGLRLKEYDDPTALEALMRVAQEETDSASRAPALRALADFSSLEQRKISNILLARLDAVAVQAMGAKHPAVREGAESLKRALRERREPSARKAPFPPGPETAGRKLFFRLVRIFRWFWLLLLPAVVGGWVFLGLPVFDSSVEAGVRAREAWNTLKSQRLFVVLAVFLWMCLSAMLAGYGFDLLALAIGRPMYDASGGWLKAYYAAGLCVFLPGGLLAAGFAWRPKGSALIAGLRTVPSVLALWVIVFTFLIPLEVFYRFLFRRGRRMEIKSDSSTLSYILETGSIRTALLASSVMACEDMGVLPAFRRSRDLLESGGKAHLPLGLGMFDLRFALLCAAPVLAFFCSIIARGQPVEWVVSLAVVFLGCGLWSWMVLAGVLFAVVETLEGVVAAQFYRHVVVSQVNEWGEI